MKRNKHDRSFKIFFLWLILNLLTLWPSARLLSKDRKDAGPVIRNILIPSPPMRMTLAPDGKQLAVLQERSITLVNLDSGAVIQNLPAPFALSPVDLIYGPDGKSLYFAASGSRVLRLNLNAEDSQWKQEELLKFEPGKFAAEEIGGLSLSPSGRYLALTLVRSKLLLIYDLSQRLMVSRVALGPNPGGVSFSADARMAYVIRHDERPLSNETKVSSSESHHDKSSIRQGQGFISLVALKEQKVVVEIETGVQPCQMRLNKDGSRLYVLDAVEPIISTMDTLTQEVTEEIPLTIGTTSVPDPRPADFCLAPDGKRLFVALEGHNAVAVFSLGSLSTKSLKDTPTRLEGIVPLEGHPRALLFTADGSRLLVGHSGPAGSASVSSGPASAEARSIQGTVSLVNLPAQKQLERWLENLRQSHKQNLSNG